jgi:hypothetical protein
VGGGGAGTAARCGGPGTTVSSEGVAPMLHASWAPLATSIAMTSLSQITQRGTTT